MAEIREGVTPNDTNWERGAIINHYSNSCWGASCNAPDNNANLKKQDVYIPGGALFTQFYDYDSLNRLQSVREDDPNGPANWKQSYVYDRYGNRTVDQNSANTYGTGIPKPNFAVDTSTNRVTVPNGLSGTMSYDAAGNLTTDTYSAAAVARLYDAENRMTKETQASSYVAGEYSYDGDGRRVKRKVGGVETWQVYGIGGELIAEYPANGAPASPQKEYGYRNGQLLITATVNSGGWGTAPTFNDNPLQVGVTTVQARHITELRTAIDAVRSHYNLGNYPWAAPAAPGDPVSIAPIQEMRTALDQALGAPQNGYTGGLDHNLPILKDHIQELRQRVLDNWQSGGGGVDIRWLVSDQLGTPRIILDAAGGFATTVRHDYLPFGEELYVGGRTSANGYTTADGTRQKFTQKERDNETALDYFGVRYYSSQQGRFISADAFWKDSQVDDPQSWNKYAYVRNNPLKYVDPQGEKADVEIQTDEKHKTGTIMIRASIAIYAANGSKLSQKDLNRAKSNIKQAIEGAWSGTVKKDGITYTVTTQVDVQVQSSEKDAMKSGAQNVIGISNGPVSGSADSLVNPGSFFGGPDTGTWNIKNLSNGGAAHEFTHLLGVDDRTSGPYLSNTNILNDSSVPWHATADDFGWALGGAIDSHRSASRQYRSNSDNQETRSSPMFRLGPPENHRSTTELRAGRIWWN